MARTGVSIKVADTILGESPRVNANSMLVVCGATATTAQPGGLSFSLKTPTLLRSVDGLANLGITQANNPDVYKQVSDFYQPMSGVNNSGTILWLVGMPEVWTASTIQSDLVEFVRSTVLNGFQYRPRNIIVSFPAGDGEAVIEPFEKAVEQLYDEGFSCVCLVGQSGTGATGSVTTTAEQMADLSQEQGMFVGSVIITDVAGSRACVGKVGGLMASLSVGTSIGDVTLPPFATTLYFLDSTSTPCSSVPLEVLNVLGDKQYIFARTRPPKNGLWLNDGATANDPANALSTLEAGRTIASMVDDLRTFFTPYINTKTPVSPNGDIDPTYKQVVLDNARTSVITPCIESGDISDARISLKALNDDMVGTRTWEVTLEILPAPTLRWVNGYVFYVKSLS